MFRWFRFCQFDVLDLEDECKRKLPYSCWDSNKHGPEVYTCSEKNSQSPVWILAPQKWNEIVVAVAGATPATAAASWSLHGTWPSGDPWSVLITNPRNFVWTQLPELNPSLLNIPKIFCFLKRKPHRYSTLLHLFCFFTIACVIFTFAKTVISV